MFCNNCGEKNIEGFKFCSSCGTKNEVVNNLEDVKNRNPTNIDSFDSLHESINCYFDGQDLVEIHNEIGELFNLKNALNIVYNLYVSEDFFIVLPISKDKSGISLWALAFGAGAIAAFAHGALKGLANKLEAKNAKLLLEKDDPLFNAIIFNKNEIKIQVKEIRGQTGDVIDFLFFKETWFQISGKGMFRNKTFNISVRFGHEGKSEKSKTYSKIIENFKITPPVIHKQKPYPF